jgi:PAS domain S-box-containing protein
LIEDLPTIRREIKKRERLSARTVQAEEELARFFALSLDLLCIAGFDGYFKRLNPAWTTHLGWTLEELETRPFLDFVHPDDRAATLAEVGKLAGGADTILFENRYRHQDGSYRWLQWTARPLERGEQIYATARDITGQRRLEREVLEILDQEKERLGRELHDGLCQTLAGIAALSSTLSKRLAASSKSAGSAAAAKITKLLGECIGDARDLARGLSPLGLNEAGLDEALEALALNVQNLFRVSCTVECDRPFLRLRPEVEAHLFRIAQEAVNNAVAHGRAERIEISLKSNDGEGLLSIRDDGIGVPEAASNPEGIGMHTMAYRARLIGASLTVRRRLRRGTAVICTFPKPGAADSTEIQDPGAQEVLQEIPR